MSKNPGSAPEDGCTFLQVPSQRFVVDPNPDPDPDEILDLLLVKTLLQQTQAGQDVSVPSSSSSSDAICFAPNLLDVTQ